MKYFLYLIDILSTINPTSLYINVKVLWFVELEGRYVRFTCISLIPITIVTSVYVLGYLVETQRRYIYMV